MFADPRSLTLTTHDGVDGPSSPFLRLAAFSLSEFEAAKQAFDKGLALLEASGKSDTTRRYRTWIRKCEAEIESKSSMTHPQHLHAHQSLCGEKGRVA